MLRQMAPSMSVREHGHRLREEAVRVETEATRLEGEAAALGHGADKEILGS